MNKVAHTWEGEIEIEPDEPADCYSAPVVVTFSGWHKGRAETRNQPAEEGYYDETKVMVTHPDGRVEELLDGPNYEWVLERATAEAVAEAAIDDAADLGDFLYDQMREEGIR